MCPTNKHIDENKIWGKSDDSVRQKNKVDCSTFRLVFVKLVW